MKNQKTRRDATPVLASVESISTLITVQRGQRVMLDADLARLYGVTTKRLNEQVKRNLERFPSDFLFQLTLEELNALRSQSATSNDRRGGRRYRPYVFTEHGVIMAANVLNSGRAVQTSVLVVRAFVRIRQFLATHVELAQKLDELQGKLDRHDQKIVAIIDAIRQLMAELPISQKPPIGYQTEARAVERKTARRRGKN